MIHDEMVQHNDCIDIIESAQINCQSLISLFGMGIWVWICLSIKCMKNILLFNTIVLIWFLRVLGLNLKLTLQDSDSSNEPVSPFDSYETNPRHDIHESKPLDVPPTIKEQRSPGRHSLDSAPGLLEGRDQDSGISLATDGNFSFIL